MAIVTTSAGIRKNMASNVALYSFVLVVAVWLTIDFVPRFYQGDSISYLMTGMGWIPPDRSWLYGYIANYLMRQLHGYEGYILLQAVMFTALVGWSQRFFADFPVWHSAYLWTAVAVCLDPVLELYIRFFMSDFMSLACFGAVLFGLHMVLDPASSRRTVMLGLAIACMGSVAAIFIRIAYVVIVEVSVLIVAALWFRRVSRLRRIALAVCVTIPFASMALMAGANALLFAKRFPHQIFLNKLSGQLLAGQFSPALQPEDFAHAGVAITPDEFFHLQLWNYDKRATQVFGGMPFDLMPFLEKRLGIHDQYDAELDRKAKLLVQSAMIRDPIAIAVVYVRSAIIYADPRQWADAINTELNLSRPLDVEFVPTFNKFAWHKLRPEVTAARTLLVRFYIAICYLYPIQLALGLGCGAYLLRRERARPAAAVLGAGFLGDLVAAPLYSNYVIARYILGAIFISYLLIGLTAASILSKKWRPRQEALDVVVPTPGRAVGLLDRRMTQHSLSRNAGPAPAHCSPLPYGSGLSM